MRTCSLKAYAELSASLWKKRCRQELLLLPHEPFSRSSHDERTGAYQAGKYATG